MWQRMKTIPDVNASLPEGALAMDETVASDDRESCLFNSCLLNFYRCEKKCISGRHAPHKPETDNFLNHSHVLSQGWV